MAEIKMFGVNMSASAPAAVERVLMSGYVGEGSIVVEFEQAIARFLGVPAGRVVAVNSCTSALMVALRLAGVQRGSLVASTPMTCLATNEPILALGASVRWLDVDPDSGLATAYTVADAMEARTNDWNLISALMVVHWGGQPCEMSAIYNMANWHGVPVIEDAAHAFGAELDGKMVGNGTSDFCCFSFQAIKQLTCVDGGALVCAREADADRARLIRWYGLNRGGGDKMRCLQDPLEWGWKFHMNNVNAAIGLANLEQLPTVLQRCRAIAGRYREALRGRVTLREEPVRAGAVSAQWLYTALARDSDTFIKFMAERGIECGRVHGRNDTKTIFAGSQRALPGVDSFDARHVCLPCRAGLSDADVERVCSAIAEYDHWEVHTNGRYSKVG